MDVLRGCLITMTKLFQYDFMAGLMGSYQISGFLLKKYRIFK